jgi:mannose-6-phosphate isomerase-like protein (cupin superfamily)
MLTKNFLTSKNRRLLMERANFLENPLIDLENCHDGIGTLKHNDAFPAESYASNLMFIHHTILPPGTSIGEHAHENEEEIYIVLEGKGIYSQDEEKFPVKAGDILRRKPYGTHGLVNTENTDLKLLVFCVEVR